MGAPPEILDSRSAVALPQILKEVFRSEPTVEDSPDEEEVKSRTTRASRQRVINRCRARTKDPPRDVAERKMIGSQHEAEASSVRRSAHDWNRVSGGQVSMVHDKIRLILHAKAAHQRANEKIGVFGCGHAR